MTLEAVDVGQRDIDVLIESFTVLCAIDPLGLQHFLMVDYLISGHVLHHFFLLLVRLLFVVREGRGEEQ